MGITNSSLSNLLSNSLFSKLDPCLMSVEPGPCRQKLARWFYSSVSARCVQFQYGGCEGNQNRFMSEDICLEQCQHLNGEPVQPLPTGTMQMPEVGGEFILNLLFKECLFIFI